MTIFLSFKFRQLLADIVQPKHP